MTECSKCGAEMPPLARAAQAGGLMDRLKMMITGYCCPECGQWNDLTKRKWWKERINKQGDA